ncbi:Single-stranded-DNA-specific exonuclease RecJ [Methyloligella halotolerans]|uniref:Single-stranded-DNA-specific exonuclease RecJ n=2 Tax=Methyloligella halotolerans TaxID=1177755 RepID=A0A1E2S2B9_9HYPH|nr:single-stranded-DNA-specific exonuclease RecJ [Methyloligella halotolerans]ODA68540.1 Single-stranded-DNA-specific exonuclease RecJ [Methyloligella halotolerans]
MGAVLPERASGFADETEAFLGVDRSAGGRRWRQRLDTAREHLATAIAQQNGLPEILGRVLAARGAEPQTVEDFFNPTLRTLMPDPASLQDMETAAARFVAAIRNDEPVAIFGDYDVDGACSITLLERFLRHHGRKAAHYIPDRLTEGYGPSDAAMLGLREEGATLILTVDCGTASHGPIAAANEAGADVIVLDHHQADETLPEALAVVNPNREDDISGLGHLAAAGVVFMFLVAVTRQLRAAGFYDHRAEPNLLSFLDLVALATICDVVPLQGINRAFVAQGLKILRLRQNPGLRALGDVSRIDEAPSVYTLGFVFGPRINAGGRTGFSGLGTALLCTDDDVEARSLADRLEALNTERKAIEDSMLQEAFAIAEAALEAEPDKPLLIAHGDGWHKGLLGLVSSRVTERFGRPSLVIAWDEAGEGTGSGRSIAGVDLGRAIRDCVTAKLLTKGGGHAMAAGFALRRDRLQELEDSLCSQFRNGVAAADEAREMLLDGALSAAGATPELLALLDQAGPFGMGHPKPRFAFPAHRITGIRVMKGTHIRCRLQSPDGARLDACAFRAAEAPLGKLLLAAEGRPLHVVGHLRINRWQGRETVELTIEDAAEPR